MIDDDALDLVRDVLHAVEHAFDVTVDLPADEEAHRRIFAMSGKQGGKPLVICCSRAPLRPRLRISGTASATSREAFAASATASRISGSKRSIR